MAELRTIYLLQQPEDLSRAQVVKSRDALFHVSLHRKGFACACLSIGEARYFSALESIFDEGTNGLLIDLVIVGLFVVGVVEVEGGLFEVLGEVNLLPE